MAFNDNIKPLLNGLIGDALADEENSWAIEMSFRLNGTDIAPKQLRQLRHKPVLIFIHGLMADERIWKSVSAGVKGNFQHLFIRYNTGLHISMNGQKLSRLLEDFNKECRPKEIALAGHSMGGLVVRSSCYYAGQLGHTWTKSIKRIFLLAVPNDGAPLEKVSHATAFLLKKIARFQLGKIGSVLDSRSNGIKDLRLGAMLDEDWNENKKTLRDHFKRTPVPALPRVHYHILIASMLGQSFMAQYFGDGLVTQASAVGETLMHIADVKVFDNTGHNSLLKSQDVIHFIAEKLKES